MNHSEDRKRREEKRDQIRHDEWEKKHGYYKTPKEPPPLSTNEIDDLVDKAKRGVESR